MTPLLYNLWIKTPFPLLILILTIQQILFIIKVMNLLRYIEFMALTGLVLVFAGGCKICGNQSHGCSESSHKGKGIRKAWSVSWTISWQSCQRPPPMRDLQMDVLLFLCLTKSVSCGKKPDMKDKDYVNQVWKPWRAARQPRHARNERSLSRYVPYLVTPSLNSDIDLWTDFA